MNKTKEKYFLYTGNAYPHKNLDRLIDAIVVLNKNYKEKILLKISSSRNAFVERLNKSIKEKNAEKYVKLLGYVSDEEIKDMYKNSIAFVFPTLAEGFGLPPMEAINSGTIAVVSDIPVLKEVYGDSVLYFNPTDVYSIANSLEEAIKLSDKDRKNKIEYSQNYVKKYSWSKMAKETLKIYEASVE